LKKKSATFFSLLGFNSPTDSLLSHVNCTAPVMKIFLVSLCLILPIGAQPLTQNEIHQSAQKIDHLIGNFLKKSKVAANPVIDDATFVRRAYLSIAGRIPTMEEAASFIDSTTLNKRRTLVDSLIKSSGYRSRMFNFWADLLRLQTNQEKYGVGWHLWIREAVEANMPYDEFVRTMLSAKGLATKNPAVGYYLRDRNMQLDNVSNTVQVFLGTRIGCAQCHDHPFDDWTQKQYYELAAFTGGTTYRSEEADELLKKLTLFTLKKKGVSPGQNKKRARTEGRKIRRDYSSLFRDFSRNAIGESPKKQLKLPDDYHYNDGKPGEVLKPQVLFAPPIGEVGLDNRRAAFANWVTSPENPYFTKVIVNRLWAEVFGRGIVDPLDNWSETTRVSHPELLENLSQLMKSLNYDTQQFMRVLYHTRLFETAAATEEAARGKTFDFRGPLLRRMSAESLHDSLIAMQFGNRDEALNTTLKTRWESYQKSVDALLHMPLPQLVALNKSADIEEKKLKEIRSEARKFREQAKSAKADGNLKLAKELNRKAKQLYGKNNRMIAEINDPTMSMLMQRKIRVPSRPSMRSSEQPSPYKAGAFMRQFGASDRQTSNASNTQASIPQALTLLNGREITGVTDGSGKLAKALRQAKTDKERLEILFLSIYGTRPTAGEQEAYGKLTSNASDLRTLARAMLTSKRFLFIQ